MFGLPTGDEENGVGQFFLLVCYGFILFKAAVLIGDGSEKLLLLYGPGIVGGLVIPILGAVPDGAIVLVSGLGADAQSEVSVGMGTLAGSTIMLLTIPWGIGVILGARDLDENGVAMCKPGTNKPKYENGLTWSQTGVTTFTNIPNGAKIMMLTALSYLILTIPGAIYYGSSQAAEYEHIPALVGMIVCALAFFAYSAYQILDSRAQIEQQMREQRLQFDKWKHHVGRKFGQHKGAMDTVFARFDKDGNGTIDRQELHEGFAAMGLECDRKQLMLIMSTINEDDDVNTLTKSEFSKAITTWAKHRSALNISKGKLGLDEMEEKTGGDIEIPVKDDKDEEPLLTDKKEHYHSDGKTTPVAETDIAADDGQGLLNAMWKDMEGEEEEEDEDMELELTDNQLLIQAMLLLVFGTVLCCIFSDPMVDVITNFSDTISVPAFYVSFIVTPLASNAAEIYSSLLFAAKKTTEGISMSFSALYGAACMNNTFVLCIFCILVFIRHLEWTFLVETMAILISIFCIGCIGLQQTIKVWHACVVISFFPLSLVFVGLIEGFTNLD